MNPVRVWTKGPRVCCRIIDDRASQRTLHQRDQYPAIGKDLRVRVAKRMPRHRRGGPCVGQRIVSFAERLAGAVFAARDEKPAVLEYLRGVIQPRADHRRERRPRPVHVASLAVGREPVPRVAGGRIRRDHRAIGKQHHQPDRSGRSVCERRPRSRIHSACDEEHECEQKPQHFPRVKMPAHGSPFAIRNCKNWLPAKFWRNDHARSLDRNRQPRK